MKAEIILKYKLEDDTPDYREIIEVTCGTELMNRAHAILAENQQQAEKNPDLSAPVMVNFNFLEDENE